VQHLRRFADWIIQAAAAIGSMALIFLMGVILVDVVGRAFGAPLYGSLDIVTMTETVLVFGGMALCDRIGGHVAVDLFERKFPDAMNRVIDIVSALIGAVIFAGIAYSLYESSKLSLMLNLKTNLLALPKATFQYIMIGFCVITGLAMLLRAAELAFTGRDIRKEQA